MGLPHMGSCLISQPTPRTRQQMPPEPPPMGCLIWMVASYGNSHQVERRRALLDEARRAAASTDATNLARGDRDVARRGERPCVGR